MSSQRGITMVTARVDDADRQLTCEFASFDQVSRLRTVKRLAAKTSDIDTIDQLDYASAACEKWLSLFWKGKIAADASSMRKWTLSNPRIEVSSMLVLRCTSKTFQRVLGVCFFHRTWRGNFFMDYLTQVPWFRARGAPHKLERIGGALLYGVARLARELNVAKIYCETSPTSCGFYQHALERRVHDLLVADKRCYEAYIARSEVKYGWKGT